MQFFTPLQYVKIDIANQFGLDRLDWDDRLNWFEDNEAHLDELSYTAKNDVMFRKAVRAFRKSLKGEAVNFGMSLDATASGIQFLSIMAGDPIGGECVNIVSTGHREDIYDSVAQEMTVITPNMNFSRDEVKKPVMTFFYGSDAEPKNIFGEGETLLNFHKSMEEVLPGAYELRNLFQSYWDPTATSYKWTMPDGHKVIIPVMVTKEKGLEIDEEDHLRFTYRVQVNEPRLKGRSLAAHITHANDGYVARRMVHTAHEQNFWLAPVHDEFYASPRNMNQVRINYRDILSKMADTNIVSNILSEMTGAHVPYTKHADHLSWLIKESEYALS